MERNAQQIICQRCKSLIFNKNVAELCTKEVSVNMLHCNNVIINFILESLFYHYLL